MVKKIVFLLSLVLSVVSHAEAQVCIWTDDPKGPACSIVPQKSNLKLGTADHPFGDIYGTFVGPIGGGAITATTGDFSGALTGTTAVFSSTVKGSAFNLTDGSDKNYSLSVYAAGTAYTLTDTSAALDFGTTDPSLTINKAGTYLLIGRANLEFVGATFAASRTVTIKLRRTNNTAADLTNGSTAIGTNIVTTVNGVLAVLSIPAVIYTTTNTNDAVTIFGDVSVVPTAGALNATEASIVAVRLH